MMNMMNISKNIEDTTRYPSSSVPSPYALRLSATQPYVLVPFRWSRALSDTGTVYYVSPSGRVLLCHGDVVAYLNEERSCKCYLDQRLTYEEVFNFDPDFGSLCLPKSVSTTVTSDPPKVGDDEDEDCESFWERNLDSTPETITGISVPSTRTLITFVRNYLRNIQMVDATKYTDGSKFSFMVYEIDGELEKLKKKDLEKVRPSDKCLGNFEWDDFVVTKNGRIYPQFMSTNQVKHLAFELIIEMIIRFQLTPPIQLLIMDEVPPPPATPPATPHKPRGRPQKKEKKETPPPVRKQQIPPPTEAELQEAKRKRQAYNRAKYRKARETETPEQKAKRQAYYREYVAKRKATLEASGSSKESGTPGSNSSNAHEQSCAKKARFVGGESTSELYWAVNSISA